MFCWAKMNKPCHGIDRILSLLWSFQEGRITASIEVGLYTTTPPLKVFPYNEYLLGWTTGVVEVWNELRDEL